MYSICSTMYNVFYKLEQWIQYLVRANLLIYLLILEIYEHAHGLLVYLSFKYMNIQAAHLFKSFNKWIYKLLIYINLYMNSKSYFLIQKANETSKTSQIISNTNYDCLINSIYIISCCHPKTYHQQWHQTGAYFHYSVLHPTQ